MPAQDLAPRRRAVLLLGLALLAVVVAALWSRVAQRLEVHAADALRLTQALALPTGPQYPARPSDAGAAQPTALPDNWDGSRPGYAGYVWYRLPLPAALPAWSRPTLYLPAAGMNAEVWLGGVRIGGAGRMQMPLSRHFYTPQLIELPQGLRADDALWVLVGGYPGYRSGLAAVWLGEHGALYDAWRWRSFWQGGGTAVTIVINLVLAAFVLTLWWRDRSHAAYAWFGAAAVVWGLRNLNYVVTEPAIPDLLFAELCVSGAAWFTALFAVFAQRFAESQDSAYRGPRWLPAAALAYAGAATAYFLSAPSYASANAGFALLAAVGIAFTLWSLWRLLRLAMRRPEPALVAVAAGAVVYLVLLLNDYAIGLDRSSLGEVFIRQYAALPLFVAITATLGQRYLQALQHARELALSLQSQATRRCRRAGLAAHRAGGAGQRAQAQRRARGDDRAGTLRRGPAYHRGRRWQWLRRQRHCHRPRPEPYASARAAPGCPPGLAAR